MLSPYNLVHASAVTTRYCDVATHCVVTIKRCAGQHNNIAGKHSMVLRQNNIAQLSDQHNLESERGRGREGGERGGGEDSFNMS